ncbi:MAG: hypothetical protein V4726_01190 [Verrucomicrobiota bacterium]
MKLTLLILWLSVPVLWAAWHYGPGQEALKRDKSDIALTAAKDAASREDLEAAIASYDEALAALPKEETAQAYRIRLARCQAQLAGQQLPEASRDLEILQTDLTADAAAPAGLLDSTQEALANTGYYMTWLMRLEGQPREVWEPEIEKSRQNFRHLAETGAPADKERYQKNLENSLRLAQMDLTELQGLPLPSQCKNCKSGRCNKPGKKQGPKKPTDSRSGGSGPPADGEGS